MVKGRLTLIKLIHAIDVKNGKNPVFCYVFQLQFSKTSKAEMKGHQREEKTIFCC